MERAVTYLCIGLGFAIASLVPPFAALVSEPPEAGKPVLVVHWPWQVAKDLVRDAGGYVLGPVQAPFGFLATSDDAAFLSVLANSPSLIVADGYGLAKMCGVV